MSDPVAVDPMEVELVDKDVHEDVAAMETLNMATEEEEMLAHLKAWQSMLGAQFPKTLLDFVGYKKSQFWQLQFWKQCAAMMAKAPHALVFQPWFYVNYMGPRMQWLWYFGRLHAGKEVLSKFDPLVRGLDLASAQEDFLGPIMVPEALPSGSGPYMGKSSQSGTSMAEAGRKELEKALAVAPKKAASGRKAQKAMEVVAALAEADETILIIDSKTEMEATASILKSTKLQGKALAAAEAKKTVGLPKEVAPVVPAAAKADKRGSGKQSLL
ncbi:hypothetical protein CALCODRAFT_488889 [Calocera cornea HHB12733]|uniref:Uncharacterized protein n=1 Tax=Calocera cornea HHB12733 TaxID=1353952 RepID=A0A165C3X2_9BASI|nr:hypothetical protein CALCODRAFT_488889 [Calocera cornea HHB12733]